MVSLKLHVIHGAFPSCIVSSWHVNRVVTIVRIALARKYLIVNTLTFSSYLLSTINNRTFVIEARDLQKRKLKD
jgi:hypothetical protein